MKTIRYGLALSLVFVAGLAGAQTIDDIQVYNEDTGAPESPFDGQVVTVEGTIYVVKGTYNGGTFYIQSDNGGIQSFAPGAPGWAIPDKIVSVTGTVGIFGGEIQITNNPVFVDAGDNPNLVPLEVTIDELLINPGNPLLYGDYEKVGEYIAVTGVVTSVDFDGGNESFFLGGTNDDLQIFVDETTGIDVAGVEVGDEYKVLGPVVNFNGEIEIKPRYQSDLIEDPTLPVIFDVNAENWVPLDDEDIVIVANVADDVGIASGELFYRDSDGENPGPWLSVPMTQTRNEDWAGTIPDPHDERQVDFYVAITDAEAQTVFSPGSAPDDFFSIAIGITPIYDVQKTPDGEEGDSPLFDEVVNIRGVITVGTNDFGNDTDSRFIVQEQEPARDGTYRWGAVLVFESSGANEYFRGDLVEVGGFVSEFNELTELLPHNPNAINLVDFADPPPPTAEMTATLADSSLGEAYESVWVRTYAAQVIDVDALPARFEVSDTGAQEDSVTVDPTLELLYVPMLGDMLHVEGFMDTFFDNRDLQPIDDQFVVLLDATAADDPIVPSLGGFKGIYPNPFNPMAKISFAVVRPSLVQLNVYDVRGIRVRSLVRDNLEAGDYNLTWDGRSDGGRELASGTYFARLRIGAEVLQVRKLQLVK